MRASSLTLLVYALACAAAPAAAQVELSVPYAVLEDNDRIAEPGERVSVEYEVRNNGPSDAEDVAVGFFFSTDRRLDDADRFLESEEVSLDGYDRDDESEQVGLPEQIAPGCYYVLVVADYTNRFQRDQRDEQHRRGARRRRPDADRVRRRAPRPRADRAGDYAAAD